MTKSFTYYDTGEVYQATDVNGAQTTYAYAAAGNCAAHTFSTSVSLPLGLSTSQVRDCNGGVVTSATDANGNPSTASYGSDPFWRLANSTDPLGNQTNFTYGSNSYESYMLFNGNNSIADSLTQLDGFGRPVNLQRQQQPGGGSNFDTVTPGYDTVGRKSSTTMPCVAAIWGHCASSPQTTQTYDGLNRPYVTTDGGTGTLTYTYTGNDVKQARGPAPTQPGTESAKQKQMEYDGLGRLTSVCEITQGTGSGPCRGRQMASTAIGPNTPMTSPVAIAA